MNLKIHNFVNSNKKIKKEYLCLSHGGNNICPKISWNCVENAKSYVIIMEDPDAAVVSNFIHLFLYIDITVHVLQKIQEFIDIYLVFMHLIKK